MVSIYRSEWLMKKLPTFEKLHFIKAIESLKYISYSQIHTIVPNCVFLI